MADRDPKEARDAGRREPSDFFSVHAAKKSIPRITKVPETKEDARRRRVVRVTVATIAAIGAVLLVILGVYLHGRRTIEDARLAIENDARVGAIESGLALLDGTTRAGDVALAARIHATAELEGMPGHREAAESLLEGHDPASDGASDHGIGETYLALAEGNPSSAARFASALVARGPRAAEAGRARALAALAIGNLPQALGAARAAVAEMPGSPRHQALLGLIAARAGEAAPLEGDAIAIRLARARVRYDAGDQRASIGEGVQSLVDDARATPAERAWARLLVALSAIDAGDTHVAATALTAAAEVPPPGDELYRIQLAEGWLALGRRVEAQTIADTFSPGISADAGRRAQLIAELELQSGRIAEAELALEPAEATPRTARLRARIADARDQFDTARALYEEAALAQGERLAAIVGLATMLARAGRAAEAVALVDPLLAERPTHPRVAAIAASAYAASGNRARALEIADAALRENAREPILLAATARIHLAASEWRPALEALRVAIEIDPGDAALHTERGRAAKELGEIDEARTAFRAAIAIDPAHAEALRSLLAIEVDTGDLEGAQATLARIDTARLASLEIEHLRARFLVASLAGQAGIDAVRRARRTARRDTALAYALARLHMQAEHWYDAIDAFADAMPAEGPAERRDVALWRVLAFARARRAESVEQLVEAMREGASENPFTPEHEARLLAAEAWAQWAEEAFGRAAILARQALARDPRNTDALLLLGGYEELQHDDPTARFRAALTGSPPSVEAMGELASVGDMDPERCGFARQYLRAAPEGAHASAVRQRVGSCPAP